MAPDGSLLAASVRQSDGSQDVFTLDLVEGRSAPLAQGPAQQFAPVWTPDSRQVAFICEKVTYDICTRAPNSTEPATLVVSGSSDLEPYSFSSDGTRLVFSENGPERLFLSQSLADPDAPPDTLRVGVTGGSNLRAPAISPNVRWLAYVSNETGTSEVWIESLDPTIPRRWQVSSGGGRTPLWTRGGQELVYRGADAVFAAPVDPDFGEPGTPTKLFNDPYRRANDRFREWDVSSDGERFIMIKDSEMLPRRLILVQNFFEELKRMVPN